MPEPSRNLVIVFELNLEGFTRVFFFSSFFFFGVFPSLLFFVPKDNDDNKVGIERKSAMGLCSHRSWDEGRPIGWIECGTQLQIQTYLICRIIRRADIWKRKRTNKEIRKMGRCRSLMVGGRTEGYRTTRIMALNCFLAFRYDILRWPLVARA